VVGLEMLLIVVTVVFGVVTTSAREVCMGASCCKRPLKIELGKAGTR